MNKQFEQRFKNIIEKFNKFTEISDAKNNFIQSYNKDTCLLLDSTGNDIPIDEIKNRLEKTFNTLIKWADSVNKKITVSVEQKDYMLKILIDSSKIQPDNGLYIHYSIDLLNKHSNKGIASYADSLLATMMPIDFIFTESVTSDLMLEEIIITLENYLDGLIIEEAK